MVKSTEQEHEIPAVADSNNSFTIKKLGTVHGVAPVSIVSKKANSYLMVYDDALFRKKALIYSLTNFSQPYRTLKRVSSLDHVSFSNSGDLLAGASYFSQFRFSGFVYNPQNDILKTVEAERYYGKASIGGGSQMFSLNQDESLMAIASSVFNNSQLGVFDIHSVNAPSIICTMNPPGSVFETKSLCWSPDGLMVAHHGHYIKAAIPYDKSRGIFLWQIDRNSSPIAVKHIGTLTYPSQNRDDKMVDLVFSPHDQMLVLGADQSSNDKLKLFDLNSQQLVFESAPLGTTTASLLYTPNGKFLISGEKDGCVHIWKVKPSFLELYKTRNFTGEIFQMCLRSADNSLLVAYQEGKKMVAVSSISLPAELLN